MTNNRHPDRSEAERRDLFMWPATAKKRSLHCASLREASVGMTNRRKHP